jgi:hypothetical protein
MEITGGTATATIVPADAVELPEMRVAGQQQMEGLRILVIGFATGMTVAIIFLIYIVLSSANAFP